MKGILLPCDAQGFSIEGLKLHRETANHESGADEAEIREMLGHWNNNIRMQNYNS